MSSSVQKLQSVHAIEEAGYVSHSGDLSPVTPPQKYLSFPNFPKFDIPSLKILGDGDNSKLLKGPFSRTLRA